MKFSHILITRPHAEAMELATMLTPFQVEAIILPAYSFAPVKLFTDQIRQLQEAAVGAPPPLLIFTSPRSVDFGLGQVPPDILNRSTVAAIGPATAQLLEQAGIHKVLRPSEGYSSEDLLKSIGSDHVERAGTPRQAFIFAAPGGRTSLNQGLEERGIEPHMLMVYERKTAEITTENIELIEQAESLLAVWTSANALNAMHQRLPSHCWYRLCQGEWLVISDRLLRVARAFSPKKLHLASGPSNTDIVAALQTLQATHP